MSQDRNFNYNNQNTQQEANSNGQNSQAHHPRYPHDSENSNKTGAEFLNNHPIGMNTNGYPNIPQYSPYGVSNNRIYPTNNSFQYSANRRHNENLNNVDCNLGPCYYYQNQVSNVQSASRNTVDDFNSKNNGLQDSKKTHQVDNTAIQYPYVRLENENFPIMSNDTISGYQSNNTHASSTSHYNTIDRNNTKNSHGIDTNIQYNPYNTNQFSPYSGNLNMHPQQYYSADSNNQFSPYNNNQSAPYSNGQSVPYCNNQSATCNTNQSVPYCDNQSVPYSNGQPAPYNTNQFIPYNNNQSAPYNTNQSAPYSNNQFIPYNNNQSAPYNTNQSAPYNTNQSAPYSNNQFIPYSNNQFTPYNNSQSVPYNTNQSAPYSLFNNDYSTTPISNYNNTSKPITNTKTRSNANQKTNCDSYECSRIFIFVMIIALLVICGCINL